MRFRYQYSLDTIKPLKTPLKCLRIDVGLYKPYVWQETPYNVYCAGLDMDIV